MLILITIWVGLLAPHTSVHAFIVGDCNTIYGLQAMTNLDWILFENKT